MAMAAGKSDSIEFIGWDGSQRTAQFTANAGGNNPVGTNDPNWVDSARGELVWLEYLNSNGDRYQAKCHCETTGGNVHPWIETEHNGRKVNVPGILITDHAGVTWTADVVGFTGQGPGLIRFNLTQGVLPGH